MALLAELLAGPYLVQGLCVALLVLLVSSFWHDLSDEIPYGRVPLVGKKWWDLSNKKAKARFSEAARALIAEGFAKVRPSFASRRSSIRCSQGWIGHQRLPGHGYNEAPYYLTPQIR